MASRITAGELGRGLARAAGLGLITLVDPNKQEGWRKQAYWLAVGALTAAEVLDAPIEELDGPGARPALAVGIAGGTFGAQNLLAKADAWTMNAVARLGTEHPRRWLAGLTAAGSLAATLLDRGERSQDWDDEYPGGEVDFETAPLSEGVRQIVSGLLDTAQDYGADELRAQLAVATGHDAGGVIDFVVDEDAPRTLVDFYTFPAAGRFERDGRTHVLTVDIEDGKLAFLSQYVEPDWVEGDPEPDWSLPAFEDVSFSLGAR